MSSRAVFALMALAAAVLTVGLVGLAFVDDGDEPEGLAALPSCRTGPAAASEASFDGLPGWIAGALDAAAPTESTCRELSFASGSDGVVAVHLRLAGEGWTVGIDAESLGGTDASAYRSLLPFGLSDVKEGLFRAEGQGGTLYAFPEREGVTWAVSVTGEGTDAEPVAVLRRLLASWER